MRSHNITWILHDLPYLLLYRWTLVLKYLFCHPPTSQQDLPLMTFYAANPQDGKLFKLASDRGFLTYTGTYAGERLGVASGGRFVSPWVLREVLEGFQKRKCAQLIKQQIILELIVPFLMYFWFCFKFVFCGWMFLLHRNGYDMWWPTYSKVWSDSCSVDVCFQLHQFHPVRKTTTRHWLSNGFVCYFHKILVVLKKERSKIQSEWCLGCVLLTRTWFYIHVQYCEMYHFPWSIDLTRGT